MFLGSPMLSAVRRDSPDDRHGSSATLSGLCFLGILLNHSRGGQGADRGDVSARLLLALGEAPLRLLQLPAQLLLGLPQLLARLAGPKRDGRGGPSRVQEQTPARQEKNIAESVCSSKPRQAGGLMLCFRGNPTSEPRISGPNGSRQRGEFVNPVCHLCCRCMHPRHLRNRTQAHLRNRTQEGSYTRRKVRAPYSPGFLETNREPL